MQIRDQKHKLYWVAGAVVIFAALMFWLARGNTFQLFHAQGQIARSERQLMLTALALMLGVMIPIVGSAYIIAWKYRDTNKRADYDPESRRQSGRLQILWWAI